VDISLLPLSQTVWKALHPGQYAMTSVVSKARLFALITGTLSSLMAVNVTGILPSYFYYPVSFILGGRPWKNHKKQAKKVTKMCHLPEPAYSLA
jgi:hypothetical protein